jgi:Mn-dependent DtxR family transcriptional regulator
MPVSMTNTEEKIWNYLVTHKTPVSAAKLSKYFIISQSKASTTLKKFADEGIADVVPIGKVKYYKVKE